MVALLSPSSTNLRRRRKGDAAVRSLPATLLTSRISELHRRLIDPASDVETVKAAKRSLLRLLSDPLTLPVITTPPMQLPVIPNADAERKSTAAKGVGEICERPLPTHSRIDPEAPSGRATPRHRLSVPAVAGMPLSPANSLS